MSLVIKYYTVPNSRTIKAMFRFFIPGRTSLIFVVLGSFAILSNFFFTKRVSENVTLTCLQSETPLHLFEFGFKMPTKVLSGCSLLYYGLSQWSSVLRTYTVHTQYATNCHFLCVISMQHAVSCYALQYTLYVLSVLYCWAYGVFSITLD